MDIKDLSVAKVNGYAIVEKNGSWFVVDADDKVVSGPHGSYEDAESAAEDLPACPPKKGPPKPPTPKPSGPGGGGFGM